MRRAVIGILAHVDAGKTTLAEALMLASGKLKKAGRVDHGDTLLDSHILERERGITIFSSQAVMETGELEITLLDTPGHVDFSAEAERVLQVLDYAVLVISGTDGVQAHTDTLWRLLDVYGIPTFVFVTKMDLRRLTKGEIISQLQKKLDEGCIDFSTENSGLEEAVAVTDEAVLESYLETGSIEDKSVGRLIRERKVFPCFFGSGLKMQGIEKFAAALERYVIPGRYPDKFGAKVFKITYDGQNNRITHMKITGGSLKVRDTIDTGGQKEKVSQIRIYSGPKFVQADEVEAGGVCAVLGPELTKNGQGLGIEEESRTPVLEPVMNYRIGLPEGADAETVMPKLRRLEEEDPQLRVTWNPHQREIHVGLMGRVQAEILKSIIYERFGVDVTIDSGRVLYKETVGSAVEGVGHYEPLRHYSEVHLLIEPIERGAGVKIATKCSENFLDRSWQQLILTHIAEKQHLGVLTGSPLTDVKITLMSGRAHLKHTVGGDFRQATYRAVRQGLMGADNILLEPYYSFRLEVPPEQIGRAINDIRAMSGTFDSPVDSGEMTLITGKAPVASLGEYAAEVAAYTHGHGRLSCIVCGYDICHNRQEVIDEMKYDPESDLENTPDSVFCAHGAGFTVKWDKVPEYMHLESCIKKETAGYEPRVIRGNLSIDDRELEAIMEREFGPIKRPQYRAPVVNSAADEPVALRNTGKYLIVDGYNVIFAWEELAAIAVDELEAARARLMNILAGYAAFTRTKVILVFDAYKVSGNQGKQFDFNNINVVYTKENETGDLYIEKLVNKIGKNEKVTVVTSDGLIQLSAVRSGVLRMSAREFENEVRLVSSEIHKIIDRLGSEKLGTIGENNCGKTRTDQTK